MPYHIPYVPSRPVSPWDTPTTATPAAQPFSGHQVACMADPQLTRRPAAGPGHAPAPRTSLPHWSGGAYGHAHDPYAAAPARTYATPPPEAGPWQQPAWGHAAAGGWAAPHHSPYGPGNQVVDRLDYHTTQMLKHDKQRLDFGRQALRAQTFGSGDAAYFQAAIAYHTQQSQAHKQAAWHEMSQLWQPSQAGQAAPGSMFNSGGWAQAATLPSVRHALNSAVDSIQRLFRF